MIRPVNIQYQSIMFLNFCCNVAVGSIISGTYCRVRMGTASRAVATQSYVRVQ